MIWEALAGLLVVFVVLVLSAIAIVTAMMHLEDRRKISKKAAEFSTWMDTVDSTVGISELLKEK